MGLREGAGQGPEPPAPAAADGGCGAPEPRLQTRLQTTGTFELHTRGGRGESLAAQGAAQELPLGPKRHAFQHTDVTQVKSRFLAPKASTLALQPLKPRIGTFSMS